MTRYSITRKRNIKKYKKSQKGRGKGRRSIRRCKTRKPKGFKKAKRHTIVKRRRMVGGDDVFNFNVDPADLQVLMSKIEKYTSPFSVNKIKYTYIPVDGEKVKGCDKEDILDTKKQSIPRSEEPIYGFENVELVAKGFALVTKTGTILSGTNRKEQINVFACYMEKNNNDPTCYAIVRCYKSSCKDESKPKTRLKPNLNMDSKILFLFKDKSIGNVTKGITRRVNGINYNEFTFTTKLSSDDDTYRILVPMNETSGLNLNEFFDAVSSTPPHDFKIKLDTMPVSEPRIIRECLDPGGSAGIPLFM